MKCTLMWSVLLYEVQIHDMYYCSTNMLIAISDQQAALYKEGKLELAIQAYQQGKIQSYKNAAIIYSIAKNTLQHCISEILSKRGSVVKNCLLTLIKEENLI